MTTQAMYCSKCRDANGHHIARGRVATEVFRRVTVVGQNENGTYECKCECGHTWSSKSKEAEMIYEQTFKNS
jgi:hypothetical protein